MESGELPPLVETRNGVLDKSYFALYKMHFDDNIEKLLLLACYSNFYTKQNDHEFSLKIQDLWGFRNIVTVSSYNVRPCFPMYWLLDKDIGLSLKRSLMSQNKFRKVKTYLHCWDNTNLDETDKWVKLRPLIEAVNEKLQQFSIFSSKLSIDEQIVPYFG